MAVLAASMASNAQAQSKIADSGVLATASTGDYAAAMIDFFFKGAVLPDQFPLAAARLAPVADALRSAMSAYSEAMLVLAAFLVFYQVVVIVADTAHQGVFMGRRANQIWGPVRLIVAFILLVPIGNGLSGGQHIVIKIATTGSNLASRAWDNMTGAFGANFFSLAPPRGPDLSNFVLASVEMELCRDIYQQAAAIAPGNVAARLTGTVMELQKLPATNTAPEIWRYTNLFNANAPMCGEYRFSGYRPRVPVDPVSGDVIAHIADDVARFARAGGDATLGQARLIAASAAPSFAGNELAALPAMRGDGVALRQSLQQEINSHLRALATAQTALAGKSLAQFDSAGWVSAGFFIPDLVRLQESYGELVAHILPDVQEPVFTHRALTQQLMGDAITLEPALRGLDHETLDGLFRFYAALSRSNARAHEWLYGGALGDMGAPVAGGFDLRDHVTAATDASAAFALFAQAIDSAALDRGVWGNLSGVGDKGSPLVLSGAFENYNPLTALIEFGRRQFDLGTHLFGVAASVMTQPQMTVPSIMAALLGGLFVIGGLGLVFLIPFLPFIRFLLAILVWLIELIEALVAMPLVALAHLSLSGDGLSGSAARQSYLLWIALALRPLLCVFGLAAGVLIFAFGLSLMLIGFLPLAQLATLSNGGAMIVANSGLVLVYDALALMIANAAFKGITFFPERALRWISPFVMTESAGSASASAAAFSGNALASSAGALIQQTIHSGGDSRSESRARAGRGAPPSGSSMTGLFPFYQPGAGGASTERTASDKTAPKAAPPLPGTPAAPVSGPVVIVDKNQPVIARDKKKDKDSAFVERDFFPDAGLSEKQKTDEGETEKPATDKPEE